mgnify:FL=1
MLPPIDYIKDTNRRLLIMSYQTILTHLNKMDSNLNEMKENLSNISKYFQLDTSFDKEVVTLQDKILDLKTELAGSIEPDDRYSN